MSYKAGYIGLIGLPNAGKSTLANTMVGEKVAIVSRKAQTTRKRVLGILSRPTFQMVFVDAPGVISSRKGINSYLIGEYHEVLETADVVLAVLNPDAHSEADIDHILTLVKQSQKPCFAVLTKSDIAKFHRLEKMKYKLRDMGLEYLQISAHKYPDLSRENLIAALLPLLPESPGPLFDTELYTTSPIRELVAEIVREKCFDYLHEELPYGLSVQIRSFEESDTLDRIHADIVIDKMAHKQIVIGKSGESLKRIGSLARKDIEELVGKKVYLELFVKVKEAWTSQAHSLREMGYV